jgi:hypothetical protein
MITFKAPETIVIGAASSVPGRAAYFARPRSLAANAAGCARGYLMFNSARFSCIRGAGPRRGCAAADGHDGPHTAGVPCKLAVSLGKQKAILPP